MTLTRFVVKNTFRNKRRSILTVVSISFSLLLLTLMMSVYRGFYIDKGSPESALRLITRHRVSLNFFLPSSYRERIRALPGVAQVAPMNWFGGRYRDDKPENFFAQFGTDPQEIFKVHNEWRLAPDALAAWQRDRAGAVVSRGLAQQHGWKVGDRIFIGRNIFPVDLELTIRGIFDVDESWNALLYDNTYVEEAVGWAKGRVGTFAIRLDSPEAVTRVAREIDDMFRNSPEPTRTESEKEFQLGFVAMLGNVKMFILSIALAVTFAILLVSANTMAMSIRERIREVAVLETLGYTRSTILTMFVGEAMFLALLGGFLGAFAARGLIVGASRSPMAMMLAGIKVTGPTLLVSLLVAALVGFLSAFVPAYRASRLNIVDGLRHIG